LLHACGSRRYFFDGYAVQQNIVRQDGQQGVLLADGCGNSLAAED
jgi:hypothetical protein